MAERRRQCLLLIAIVAASAVLRFVLCARGGQYFIWDELRYDRGVNLYNALLSGDTAAVREVLSWPEHPLFAWLGAAVTGLQRGVAAFTPYGDWAHHPENIGFTMWIGCCILSLFSALNILLVGLVSRTLGASWAEALWAALLMAVSNTALYFSRHLVPYDVAICAALASLLAGLGPRPLGRVMLSGALAGAAYCLYNGYWFLPPVIALLCLNSWKGDPRRVRMAVCFGLALVVASGAVFLVGTWAGGMEYWKVMRAFSRTVTLGLYSEGWSLPWAYLWYSEGGLGAAVLVLAVAAWIHRRRSDQAQEPRLIFGLAGAGTIYGLMVLFSVVMQVFVVYGRTVKPLVPFLCIAGGCALHQLVAGRRTLKWITAAALVVAGVLMVIPHYTFIFPREAEIYVLKNFGNPKRTLSVSGSVFIPLGGQVSRPDLALVNSQVLYPIKDYIGYPEGRTVYRAENVLTYRPFQYEGHTPRERKILQEQDISIRLILLRHPELLPDNLPYELRNQTRPDGHGS